MEILSERQYDGTERNAFTIRSIHSPYTVKVDCEPVLKFRWNTDTEHWEYAPSRHFAYTSETLEPNEILVRIPLDDTSEATHKPYVDDLSYTDVFYKVEHAIDGVMQLPEPACAMNLKKALIALKRKESMQTL